MRHPDTSSGVEFAHLVCLPGWDLTLEEFGVHGLDIVDVILDDVDGGLCYKSNPRLNASVITPSGTY